MAGMPADAGGRSAKLDAETHARIEREQRSGPYRLANRLANRLGSDDVIDPRDMRNAILGTLTPAENR